MRNFSNYSKLKNSIIKEASLQIISLFQAVQEKD